MGAFRGQQPFLQNQSWQNQALNALHYNTSQPGAVIPLIYGTCRQQVNLIALGRFSGPNGSGKKGGGTGSLPLTGTNTTRAGGKGGGGGKGAGKGKGGGKKGGNGQDFMIDCDFGMCHGPIQFPNNNLVFANAGVETFNAAQAHFYDGSDGQTPDPIMDRDGNHAGYSGTCHIAFTPMDLGMTPALPNLSFELNGMLTGTGGPTFPVDANPGFVILDFLTNPRYGAGFPLSHMTDLRPGVGLNSYGDYCQAAQFAISTSLDAQQKAAEWLDGLAKLTNTAIVWSGEQLHFIPYGDLTLGANGALWTPNLVPEYSLTDHDFLPWHPHQDGAGPTPGDDDPVLITRTNPADAINSIAIEYTERDNFYNATMIPVFDQSAIDLYGLRTGENLPGKAFCNSTAAQTSAQIYLQRLLYVRNFYKFKLGWQFCRLDPMDIVLLTDTVSGLNQQAVRITSIEEDENGDLTIEAEELSTGASVPAPVPVPGGAPITSPSFDTSSRFAPTPDVTVTNNGLILLNVAGSKIVLALIVNRGTPTGTQNVVVVADNLNLAWHHRWSFDAIGSDGVEISMELWWANSSAITGTTANITVTATFGGPATGQGIFVTPVVGPVNLAAPFDTNPSFPAKQNGNLMAPAVSGLTTNSPNAMLIAFWVSDGSWTAPQILNFSPPPPPQWGMYIDGLAATFPDGVFFTGARISQTAGVSNYTAQPFWFFPTSSPNVNPTAGPYMLVVDAIAGT